MGVIAKGIPRGCQGLFTPVSLGYPLSVFNKNSTLNISNFLVFHCVLSFQTHHDVLNRTAAKISRSKNHTPGVFWDLVLFLSFSSGILLGT